MSLVDSRKKPIATKFLTVFYLLFCKIRKCHIKESFVRGHYTQLSVAMPGKLHMAWATLNMLCSLFSWYREFFSGSNCSRGGGLFDSRQQEFLQGILEHIQRNFIHFIVVFLVACSKPSLFPSFFNSFKKLLIPRSFAAHGPLSEHVEQASFSPK